MLFVDSKLKIFLINAVQHVTNSVSKIHMIKYLKQGLGCNEILITIRI